MTGNWGSNKLLFVMGYCINNRHLLFNNRTS
uniref:Uncharacterized protein n=1 Tax=Anguilla anguilla TaxID=7936 RepID=A0A0E9UJV6_ANGAN